MDPQTVFCPNSACPASGRIGAGNIGIHSRKEQRYICRECGQTFAETKGTAFYRLRTARDLVVLVVTLLAHGYPLVGLCHMEHCSHWAGRAQFQPTPARRATAHLQAERSRFQLQFALLVKERHHLWRQSELHSAALARL